MTAFGTAILAARLRLVVGDLAAHGQALGGLLLANDVHDGVDQGQVREACGKLPSWRPDRGSISSP